MQKLETAAEERDRYFNELISFKMKVAESLDSDLKLQEEYTKLIEVNKKQQETIA
jgi:hypothetical protein